ncbi:cupin-like domain-containing protein [Sphingobium amiense]|uniref:Cupin-like domain-containing protein n=1 Tax=Sphingobium amiense TaxID=135719 RepID=A0A494W6N5_9SPHN|nr:cupin-like domain-containing protein [Sphingobium amiense]BBD99901.1 cupin-like domain-containing protein [Sphingobium amiense]
MNGLPLAFDMPPPHESIEEMAASQVSDAAAMQRLALQCRPVVIRGVLAHWPAVDAARRGAADALAYLRQFAAGHRAEYFSADADLAGRYHYGEGPGGFNFTRKTASVKDALDRIEDNALGEGTETAYLGSLPADIHYPGFAQANGCDLLPSGVHPRLWVGNRSTVACHYDVYDNLACVVAGRRRFTVYPPDAIGDLYIGPIDHTLSGQPVSLADGAGEADPRYPRFALAKERAMAVELAPGDALYLPKLWWHQVEATEPLNILANYWWDGFSAGPDSPYAAMMLAMITLAERPAEERAAWRAFYDHYVFRERGHPLAHMPEAQHGVLGRLSENYGRIRTMVMRMLRAG